MADKIKGLDLIIEKYNRDIETYNITIGRYGQEYDDKRKECIQIKNTLGNKKTSRELKACATYLSTINKQRNKLINELEQIKFSLYQAELLKENAEFEKERAEFNKRQAQGTPKKKSSSRRGNSVAPAPEEEITLAPLRPPVSATSPQRLILDRSPTLPNRPRLPSLLPSSQSGPRGQQLLSSKSKRQPRSKTMSKKKTKEEILEYNNLKVAIIFYIDLRTQYFYLFIKKIYEILRGIEENIKQNDKITTTPFNINLDSINDIIVRLSKSQYVGISGFVREEYIYIENFFNSI